MLHPSDVPVVLAMARAPAAPAAAPTSSASSSAGAVNQWQAFAEAAASASAAASAAVPNPFAALNSVRTPPFAGKVPSEHAPHLKADALNSIVSGQFVELSTLPPLQHHETLAAAGQGAQEQVTVVDGAFKLVRPNNRPPITALKVWYVAWAKLKAIMQAHLKALHLLVQTSPQLLMGYNPLSSNLIQQMDAYEEHIVRTPATILSHSH